MTTATIAERPILFSGPMVKAILECRKTQTRRVVKPQLPDEPTKCGGKRWGLVDGDFYYCGVKCPYGVPGDRLWVRHAYSIFPVYFRPINGYEGIYGAGTDGRIYRVDRTEPEPLKGTPTSKGYLCVSLSRNGQVKTHAVHVLICESFYGPKPSPELDVRHVDGNQANNLPGNLDWGTASDNWTDRKRPKRGIHAEHHAAKLTAEQITEIRASSLSQRTHAKHYGVSQSTIGSIKGDYPELDREPPADLGSRWFITALVLVLVIGMVNWNEASGGGIVLTKKGGLSDKASLVFVQYEAEKHGLSILDSQAHKLRVEFQVGNIGMSMFQDSMPSGLERRHQDRPRLTMRWHQARASIEYPQPLTDMLNCPITVSGIMNRISNCNENSFLQHKFNLAHPQFGPMGRQKFPRGESYAVIGSVSGILGGFSSIPSDLQGVLHFRRLPVRRTFCISCQRLSGAPKVLRVIDQPSRDNSQKPSKESDQPLGIVSRFLVSFAILLLGFHLQLASYGYIDRGRKFYGYGLLLLGIVLGFTGPFSFLGDWWNRLWSVL